MSAYVERIEELAVSFSFREGQCSAAQRARRDFRPRVPRAALECQRGRMLQLIPPAEDPTTAEPPNVDSPPSLKQPPPPQQPPPQGKRARVKPEH